MLAIVISSETKASALDAWVVIDGETGRYLDGSNEHVQMPIASLTKIWTAFTVLESGAPLGETIISADAATAEGSSIYLKQGTKVGVEDLLYGLMLRSGNDAAHALAEHVGGSMEGFVNLMNENANLYGLKDTFFTNSSGLSNDRHLSTAFETGLMMHYALKNEAFRKISSTLQFTYKMNGETYSWRNKHRLLHSNEFAFAGKTGFTKIAGRTLVTNFEKDGKSIIVVTLNDGNDWNTHQSIANNIFSNYDVVTIAKKGSYMILPGVIGRLDEPIKLLLKKSEKKNVKHIVRIPRGKEANSVGRWTVVYDEQNLLTRKITISQN